MTDGRRTADQRVIVLALLALLFSTVGLGLRELGAGQSAHAWIEDTPHKSPATAPIRVKRQRVHSQGPFTRWRVGIDQPNLFSCRAVSPAGRECTRWRVGLVREALASNWRESFVKRSSATAPRAFPDHGPRSNGYGDHNVTNEPNPAGGQAIIVAGFRRDVPGTTGTDRGPVRRPATVPLIPPRAPPPRGTVTPAGCNSLSVALTVWLSMLPAQALCVTGLLADLPAQGVVVGLPGAVVGPSKEVVIVGRPGGKVVRQTSSGTAVTVTVEDGIDDVTRFSLAGLAQAGGGGSSGSKRSRWASVKSLG